ncbi:MAG: hypothetical protein KQJ78_04590 [Deltaproteobacteria bacterium]|nr:hypothetical protein [Deltaproteobacteria bacterium]
MPWLGPYKIRTLLENCLLDNQEWPRETKGVYLVSQNGWRDEPKLTSVVLYVGSNTGNSDRFRTRIGDLIADMFGFYGRQTGHHSGGANLWYFCYENSINPLDLYLGWKNYVHCALCEENKLYDQFQSKHLLNKKRPSECKGHDK